MLQFILGKACSGKSYLITQKIKSLSENNCESILIVPEQFTFESERNILSELGDKAFLNTSVLSFTRLCDEVGRNIGGMAGTVLSDADKIIFMSRALESVKDKLNIWRKFASSASFAKSMIDTIGEFKINACSSDDLIRASELIESPSLSNKLKEIALIYNEYDLLVGEKFIDTADSLTKLYFTLENYKFFKGKNVFIDSFKGFTGQQFKIIERIISQAENVYISLTDNLENTKQFGLFTNIRLAAEKIKKYATAHSVEIAEPIILNETYFKGANLKNFESFLSNNKSENTDNDASVIISKCTDIYGEAEAIARTIRKLVRTENYRFRDFVIIARDADTCADAVLNACKRNKISCFYDNRVPLSSFPLAVAINAAISAVKLNSEDIFKFNKTALGNLKFNEIFILENYVNLWNIDGEDWLKDWDMNPKGFTTNTSSEEETNKKLAEINRLRELAIAPIINFKNRFNSDTKTMVNAIFKLIDECDIPEKLIKISKNADFGDFDRTFEIFQSSYKQYIEILNSLVRCYGESGISVSDFSDNLNLSVSLATVGVIPQMLDQVTFGSADRIRPSRPKIAFILGANQGKFPMTPSNNGLFNIIERRNLINAGLNIADNSVYSYIDEEFLVYCNLCCPSEVLYIFYSEQTISGEVLEPSSFVLKAKEKLNLKLQDFSGCFLNENSIPETFDTAFTDYCKFKLNCPDSAKTISLALNGSVAQNRIEFLNSAVDKRYSSLNQDVAKKLYGSNIKLSATKFDTFNRCKFSFFCRYGLGAKRLQPADFDVMQRGTVVHFVLEQLISKHSGDIETLSSEELDLLTEKYINLYLDSVSGYRSREDARIKFLVSRITRSLKEVIRHVAAEIAQSEFKPVACELGIGTENSDISVTFPFESGKISLIGSIDRVDEYNGYIRIIDYKTGSKSFKLPDILFGLNLQMLIYLYAVIRGRDLPDTSAAGILYQPSSRDINDNGMAMNGLLPLEPELIFAMDKKGEGEFVPKLSFTKNGTVSKRSNSFIEKENFSEIFDYIELLMSKTGNSITSGDITVSPTDGRESAACKYCDFSKVCGFKDNVPERVPDLNNEAVFEKIKEVKTNGI